jgi:hypothetical protein
MLRFRSFEAKLGCQLPTRQMPPVLCVTCHLKHLAATCPQARSLQQGLQQPAGAWALGLLGAGRPVVGGRQKPRGFCSCCCGCDDLPLRFFRGTPQEGNRERKRKNRKLPQTRSPLLPLPVAVAVYHCPLLLATVLCACSTDRLLSPSEQAVLLGRLARSPGAGA